MRYLLGITEEESWKHALINLMADENNLSNVELHVAYAHSSLLETNTLEIPSRDKHFSLVNEAFLITTQVNYVGKATNTYEKLVIF